MNLSQLFHSPRPVYKTPEMKPLEDKIFFSYATVAPMSQPVYEAVKTFHDEFYQIGPPEVLYKYDPYVDKMAEEAAKLLHCDPSEITYIKNTTDGIGIAADALPLNPGDEILVLGNEYPANLLPWLKKRNDGLDVRVIPGTDSERTFHELLESISSKTKAIAISAIQYYDGYQIDLDLLSRTCREKGIYLVLDAVQMVGIRAIDLTKTPVDFLICGGQKYLQAGMGIGFMYVNKNTLHKLREPRVGIRSMDHFDESSYVLRDTAARFQDGTQNVAGIVALFAALKRVNELGVDTIEQMNLELLGQIKQILSDHNIPFIDRGTKQGNIVSMRVNDTKGLFNYLKEHSVYIKPIKDIARLSFIHETKIEDVQTLAALTRQWLDGQNQ